MAMTRKQNRLMIIGAAGLVLAAALTLVMIALNDEIVFFMTPTQAKEKAVAPGQRFRLGGLVQEGSLTKDEDLNVAFVVDDGANQISVRYQGHLPDLLRGGQGVVTDGALNDAGIFVADTVLAKHDETYVPKEVAEALKEQGTWQGGE